MSVGLSTVSCLLTLGGRDCRKRKRKETREAGRKSLKREKDLPKRKERRGRKAPEGVGERAHGRLQKGERFEAKKEDKRLGSGRVLKQRNKLVKMRREEQIIHPPLNF